MNKLLILLLAVILPCYAWTQQFPPYDIEPLFKQPIRQVDSFVIEKNYTYKRSDKLPTSIVKTYGRKTDSRTINIALKKDKLTSFMAQEFAYNFYNVVKVLLASDYQLRTDKSTGDYLGDAPKLVAGGMYAFENKESHLRCVVICPYDLTNVYEYISIHYSLQ